jgi:ubiquitin-like protein ATG12
MNESESSVVKDLVAIPRSDEDDKKKDDKVKVHFVAVGSAPIMKKTKFILPAENRFVSVNAFLRKVLRLPTSSSLFLYCSSAFVPGPDELVGDLRDCFGVRDELVIHYSLQEAWG